MITGSDTGPNKLKHRGMIEMAWHFADPIFKCILLNEN